MPLTSGTRIGPYEVQGTLGAGGMGEVYRARDTQLQRDVAVKVLPDAFALDSERLARFEREARTLATLNHPHVAQVYGLEALPGPAGGHAEGRALVMELVEGPTLADRLDAGALPVEESLAIAHQIALALKAAHAHGIVHRDLKPANVKVRADGVVKVLDFGLAKALDGHSGSGPVVSHAPTITTPAMTQVGMILGTAAYMAPEQARGRDVDARADVWAFGCVLLEMLTGRRAFEGEDVSDTLAAVLRSEPAWDALPADLPSPVRVLLRGCLERDRARRVQDMSTVLFVLDQAPALSVPTGRAADETRVRDDARRAQKSAVLKAVTAAVVASTVLAGGGVWWWRSATETVERPLQLSISVPGGRTPGFLEISPDGRRILSVFTLDGRSQIQLRRLDDPGWQTLNGTAGARTPFWSPDGRFIAFYADSKLKVIPAAGGPPRELCDGVGPGSGGTWHRSGAILFGGSGNKLYRVAESGGGCTALAIGDGTLNPRFPVFHPDGNHFFFVVGGIETSDLSTRGVYVAALDDLKPRKILEDVSSVVYAPPIAGESAHLLFLREGTLMAQPFDDTSHDVVGDPFPVAPGASMTFQQPQVAASVANSVLLYVGGSLRARTRLMWIDDSGTVAGILGSEGDVYSVFISPDGRWSVETRVEQNALRVIWLAGLSGDADRRLLPPGVNVAGAALWAPSGDLYLRVSAGLQGPGVYRMDLDGGGRHERLLALDQGQSLVPSGLSRDGRFLFYTALDPKTGADIWYLPWSATPDLGRAVKFLGTEAQESQAQLSPDGRWLAYSSSTSETGGVHVRAFPGGPGVWTVGVERAREPRWSKDGSRLYVRGFAGGDTRTASLFEAQVSPDAKGLSIGAPRRVADMPSVTTVPQGNVWGYDVHPDGKRILLRTDSDPSDPTINIITDWQRVASARSVAE